VFRLVLQDLHDGIIGILHPVGVAAGFLAGPGATRRECGVRRGA
jgi:hypothetical protein